MQPQLQKRLAATLFAAASFALSTFFVVEGLKSLSRGAGALVPDVDVGTAPARRDVQNSPARIARRVLARNMFDSTVGPLTWELPPPPAPPAPASWPLESPAPRCETKLRMVGSLIIAAHPERSLAMFQAEQETKLVRVGETIGEHTVLALRASHAYVQQGDAPTPCLVPLFLSAEERRKLNPPKKVAKRAKSKPKKSAKRTPPSVFSDEEMEAGIVALGGDRYRISKALFQRAMTQATAVVRGARFRPHKKDGRAAGVKLYGVRKNSVLHRLGLRSGDLLEALNGYKLADLSAVLEVYGALRSQDSFTLAISRRGTRKALTYTLQ